MSDSKSATRVHGHIEITGYKHDLLERIRGEMDRIGWDTLTNDEIVTAALASFAEELGELGDPT